MMGSFRVALYLPSECTLGFRQSVGMGESAFGGEEEEEHFIVSCATV